MKCLLQIINLVVHPRLKLSNVDSFDSTEAHLTILVRLLHVIFISFPESICSNLSALGQDTKTICRPLVIQFSEVGLVANVHVRGLIQKSRIPGAERGDDSDSLRHVCSR